MIKNIKKTTVTALAFLMATPAFAADIGETFTNLEKEQRGFYFGLSVGPEALVVNIDDGGIDSLIANTFAGIGGTAQVCKRGVGSADFIDLCVGGHVFRSLTSGASASTQFDLNGNAVAVNSEADITTFGAFAQVKANVGPAFIGPFAGVRRINTKVTFDNAAILQAADLEDTALFGGAELGFNAFNQRIQLGLTAEGGTSVSDNEFTYGRFGGFLRAKF